MLLHSGIPIPFYSIDGSKQRMKLWLYSVGSFLYAVMVCKGDLKMISIVALEQFEKHKYCLMVKGVNCYPPLLPLLVIFSSCHDYNVAHIA